MLPSYVDSFSELSIMSISPQNMATDSVENKKWLLLAVGK